MATKKKIKEVTPEQKTFVYVGKSYPNLVTHGEMFTNGVPERVKQLSDNNPSVAVVIIPIEELPQAIKDINRKKGKYYAAYMRTGGKINV